MAKYLVTGGCGFIGSHLSEALIIRGDEVIIIDNLSSGKVESVPPKAEVIIGDINNKSLLQQAMKDVDGCFHLAAIRPNNECNESWLKNHRNNLTGTIHVLNAAHFASEKKMAKIVYASSATVYGDNASIPLNENADLNPQCAYGADKLAAELHAKIAGSRYGLHTLGLRFFNIYGPGQNMNSPYSGVISKFINHILLNEPITIFGNGQQARDFVYIDDAINFLLIGMLYSNTTSPVYNVCRGQATSIRLLTQSLFAISGKTVPIKFETNKYREIQTSIGNPKRAYEKLGISAQTSLSEGLTNTYNNALTSYQSKYINGVLISNDDITNKIILS